MSKWAYDYTNHELMDAYWQALAKAAVSGSGLVIDFMAGSLKAEAYYFHGVVLSRLEGLRPTFARGDKVRISPKATYLCHSVNMIGEYSSSGKAEPKTEYQVDRIWYEKIRHYSAPERYGWTISLKPLGDPEWGNYRFPADRFEKVEQKETATN